MPGFYFLMTSKNKHSREFKKKRNKTVDKETAKIMVQSKSMGLGMVLAIVFGFLGLFYASVKGGLIMAVLELICIILSIMTFIMTLGFGAIILIPACHIACAIWANVAIKNHNAALFKE